MFRRFGMFVVALIAIVLFVAVVSNCLGPRADVVPTSPPGLLAENSSTHTVFGNTVYPSTTITTNIEDGSIWTVVRVDGRGEDAVATFTNGIRTVSGYCVNAGMDIPPKGAQYYAYLNGGTTFMSIDTRYQNFRVSSDSGPNIAPASTLPIFTTPNPTSTNMAGLGAITTPTKQPVFTRTVAPLPTVELPVLPGTTITVDEPQSRNTGFRIPGWIVGAAMAVTILFLILLRVQDRVGR